MRTLSFFYWALIDFIFRGVIAIPGDCDSSISVVPLTPRVYRRFTEASGVIGVLGVFGSGLTSVSCFWTGIAATKMTGRLQAGVSCSIFSSLRLCHSCSYSFSDKVLTLQVSPKGDLWEL
jgi:hypothetical protein